MSKIHQIICMCLTVIVGVLSLPAIAQDFPTKPVTMIVPFPPGGGTDTGARQLAQKLSELWKQPVIIENKPGAAGNIGLDYAARQKPDGYTILMGNIGTQAINSSLYKNLPFNAETAFKPISLVAELPLLLVVNQGVQANSVGEFITLLSGKPGEFTYGTSGQGSSMHLASALFEDRAKLKVTHVPYKGGGPALQDLIGGHIHFAFATVLETISHVKSGKIRALAASSIRRSPALPDVPTLAETVLPEFDSVSWIGLLAPAGTPDAIVEKISADARKILEEPDMKEKLITQGAIPRGMTPAAFANMIANDRARYARIIREKNIILE